MRAKNINRLKDHSTGKDIEGFQKRESDYTIRPIIYQMRNIVNSIELIEKNVIGKKIKSA